MMGHSPRQLQNTANAEHSDNVLFADAFAQLKKAVIKQGEAQRRVAVRVKYLIRSLMIAIVTALLFIVYLIFLLNRQVDILSNQLDLISIEGDHVLQSVNNIDTVMMKFEAQMDTLPFVNESVANINENLSLVKQNIAGISDNLGTINQEVYNLKNTMGNVSINVQHLDSTVHQVNSDVNATTEPVKRFNDLNPFNFMW